MNVWIRGNVRIGGNVGIRGRGDELGVWEGGEQVNGFLAGELDGRGVEEQRAEIEKEVCRDRGRCRGRCVSLTSHLVELAPKKLVLLEHIHGKGVLPL